MEVFPFLSKTLSGLKVMTEIAKTHPHSGEIFLPGVAGLSLAMFEMNQPCIWQFHINLPIREIVGFTSAIVPDTAIPDRISREECTKEELITWSTKEAFINPLQKIASLVANQGRRVYVYRIDSFDPFPGPLQGFAWHSFGIPLTFYQPPCQVYPELASTQDHMSISFLDFFHGLEPWEVFNEARRILVFKGELTKVITGEEIVMG
jgi:hypothetical protein